MLTFRITLPLSPINGDRPAINSAKFSKLKCFFTPDNTLKFSELLSNMNWNDVYDKVDVDFA